MSVSVHNCPQASSGQTSSHYSHVGASRQMSNDVVDDEGCCLARIFLSNIVSFATQIPSMDRQSQLYPVSSSKERLQPDPKERSRRKGDVNKENGAIASTTQVGGKSATIGSDAIGATRKSPSEMGICDSVDEQMLIRLTALPLGMDKNEWLATHTLSLFENVNALCGTMTELCTPVSCPIMSYPGVPKAHWVDERRKHHPYSAMQYIDCVMSLCETSSKDEQLFPTKYGSVFAGNFESHCRRIVRLLWHCCGHLYAKHWEQLAALNLRAQCSLVLAHMHIVAKMYALLDSKELSALSHTLQLVRPVIVMQPCGAQGIYSAGMGRGSTASRYSRVPSSKSGSWGGHPTPAVLACKPYAQTC